MAKKKKQEEPEWHLFVCKGPYMYMGPEAKDELAKIKKQKLPLTNPTNR